MEERGGDLVTELWGHQNLAGWVTSRVLVKKKRKTGDILSRESSETLKGEHSVYLGGHMRKDRERRGSEMTDLKGDREKIGRVWWDQ